MSGDPDKPKIFVDEDWKAQVQAEKEKSRSSAEPTNEAATSSSPVAELPDEPLPATSLAFLLTTLATQAMIALGQIPNPITGKTEFRQHQAKHFIDTLGMLEQKTAGNRTADESAMLDALLHQLRMAYVLMQNEPKSAEQKDIAAGGETR